MVPRRLLLRPFEPAAAIAGRRRCFAALPEQLAVVGAGQMGTGIAIVAARHVADRVLVFDKFDAGLQRSEKFVSDWVAKEVQKERMSATDGEDLKKKLEFKNLDNAKESLGEVGFVIEAVSEDLAHKEVVFKTLDDNCGPDAILASNTSSISITKIAAFTKRPEKVVGMHFMNPVPVMKGLELIRGLATADETMEITKALGLAMKKEPTECLKDMPGFLVNRVLMPMINEAIIMLHEGVMTKEDIDTSMKVCTGFPMGPLTLADFIGLDTCLAIMEVLHTETGDSKYRPAPLLPLYVRAGWHGKKTGRGFYDYRKASSK